MIAALAVGAAYLGGSYLNKYYFAGEKTTTQSQTGASNQTVDGSMVADLTTPDPAAFNLYVVQVGAFKSPTGAQQAAAQYQSKGQVGFANINTNGFSYAYVGGVYTAKKDAEKMLADLKTNKVLTDGFIATLKVPYGPDAITAMAGDTNKTSVTNGYSTLNTYLHEVAVWMENRAAGTSNPVGDMVSLGKNLSDLANQLDKTAGTDEKMKQFVAVAKEAGEHSLKLQAAANAQDTSAEYMGVMNGYMSLLAHYNALEGNTTASTKN